jgi:hypothetical protein
MADDIQQRISKLASQVESAVTRAEFDELKALVQRLVKRLDDALSEEEIPSEHLAIMSAVFAVIIGKKFRINQVKRVTAGNGWAQAGRVQLHAQRHVRRPQS